MWTALQACRRDTSVASVEMYALKVAASLMVGIAGGLWMFSRKTCQSWSACMSRCGRQLSPNSTAAGNIRGRPTSLHRPAVVPPVRHDSRPGLSTLSPPSAAASTGVGGQGQSSSLYSALDAEQRSNTVGRRTMPTTAILWWWWSWWWWCWKRW